MKFKPTPIASAVFLAFAGAALPARAQQAPATQETITVTGIRASVEKSIQTKKNADGVVEVVSQEDIGKMPDKNVADAVQRLPGVTISSQSGGSGGFDENDRVSMRGTNPSLTQTLINGHPVASGDWFVLDQVGLVGRSVSFSMLPSEIVSQVIVRKTATADLIEGGVAGAVDIITLRPLDFRKRVSAEASIGAVYADLPKKWDGQFNGLVNWKNDANTFGVLIQGFDEKRHLRRDGQEILGYGQISPGSALARARPDLASVFYPTLIGSAFFEQERERKGGLIDIQVKPTNALSVDLSAFLSRLDATNYNRNWMMWGSHIIGCNFMPSSYTVRNGTLVAASWAAPGTPTADCPGRPQFAIVDEIYRPGTYSETNFVDLDAKWRMTPQLALSGKIGQTRGKGVTPEQAVFEGDVFNTGANYSMNGTGSPVTLTYPGGNPSVFTGTSLDWIFGASPASTEDKEKYAQADGEWGFGSGMFNTLKFGGRWSEHTRDTHQVAQGPKFCGDSLCGQLNLPAWNGQTYPSDFGDRLGGTWPRNVWMIDPGVLQAWAAANANRDPIMRHYWPGEFALKETVNAAYVMTNLEGSGWSGNLGVRFVKTKERVTVNVAIPDPPCPALQPCPQVPGAITSSAFGSYYQKLVSNDYNDVLPSANLRVDLGNNMVARFAVARTMARPDYSALGGSITADDTTHTGSGGNPNLKPIRSWNYDAAFEWYYAPRSLLSAGVFYMDLQNYVAFGTYQQTLLNIRTGAFDTYTITAPINSKGRIYGIELAWQQPIAWGFGVQANYTYADAYEKNAACYTSSGAPIYGGAGGTVAQTGCQADLVGASKNTYNLSAYYENGPFGARLNYTYRSHFFVGLDRSTPQYQDDTGVLSASLNYDWSRNISLHFDALNLNDPVLKMYGANTDQPRAFYANGRQYYFTVRVKF